MNTTEQTAALLVLEDGTVFRGLSIGAIGETVGEVVFNTAMTGYQEILTDPSYARQIVTLTCAHIGNTGTNPDDYESATVSCAGLIIRDLPRLASNFRKTHSLPEFLRQEGVIAICGIDTRKLTRLLRTKGALKGSIISGKQPDENRARELADAFPGLQGMDLARTVSTEMAYDWEGGVWDFSAGYERSAASEFNVVAYDFGIKRNILRLLTQRGCQVHVVPATTTAGAVLEMAPDGVFLSNGPGDPQPCSYAIEAVKAIVDAGLPVFGICLGHQILALASGASSEKMKFGHHGANHPVKDLATQQVLITSQNHGFAISEENFPATLRVTHRSLFDQTIQGIELIGKAAYSFQGHPEASPGPHDVNYLFDRFIDDMQTYRESRPLASREQNS